MKSSSYILQVIKKEGIHAVFLVPGGIIDPLLEALSEDREIKTIVAAHEEGAAFMADGYARATGRFGVLFVIGGPGVTNASSGIATAFADRSPVLVVSGEVKTEWEGRGSFQDSSSAGIDSTHLLQSITSMHLNISHVELLKHHLDRIMRNMLSHSTRGPVHLTIPTNIQISEVTFSHKKLPVVLYHPRFVDLDACDQFWKTVGNSKKVAILAGTGTLHSGASQELIAFAEKFEIPVATTLGAKGVIPEDHRLALGVLGWFGSRHAIETLLSGDVEVLIVIGSRLNMLDTLLWSRTLQPKKALILNDINTNSIFRDYSVDLPILGDAKSFLMQLNSASSTHTEQLAETSEERKKWLEEIRSTGSFFYHPENMKSSDHPVHPARAVSDLRKVMPRDTVVFADSGAHGFFAAHFWISYAPRQFFSSVKYMGCMGWAIGAAVGAKVARPDLPCVVITGDGCMLMNGIEVQTAARYNLPVIFVVINNSALGNPKLRADKISPEMTKLHELPTHDWAQFAESLGAVGFTVKDPEDLIPVYQKALAANKTVVIDIICGNYATPTETFDAHLGGK